MIVAITEYMLDENIDAEQARELSKASIDKFEGMPGLHRKYFMLSENGATGASVYLWESKRHAEEFFTEEWRTRIKGKYGNRPKVTYYNCSIVVDNVSNEVLFGRASS